MCIRDSVPAASGSAGAGFERLGVDGVDEDRGFGTSGFAPPGSAGAAVGFAPAAADSASAGAAPGFASTDPACAAFGFAAGESVCSGFDMRPLCDRAACSGCPGARRDARWPAPGEPAR